MSSSHVRLVVAGLSVILAVLTGLVTGFAGGGSGCEPAGSNDPLPKSPAASQPAPGGPAVPSGPAGEDNQPNGNQQPNTTQTGSPDRFNTGFPPPAGNAFTGNALAAAEEDCDGGFSPLTAILGFGGALFTALIAAGIALFLPRSSGAAAAPPAPARGPHLGAPTSAPPDRSAAGRAVRTPTGSYPVLGDAVSSGAPAGGTGGTVAGTTLTAGAGADRRLAGERRTLIDTAIYVRDRATSKAIADRLAWALGEVGVVEVRPTGEVFDTAKHEAGGTAATEEAHLEGTVAAVEISGYTDRGTVVRPPVVTVYRNDTR